MNTSLTGRVEVARCTHPTVDRYSAHLLQHPYRPFAASQRRTLCPLCLPLLPLCRFAAGSPPLSPPPPVVATLPPLASPPSVAASPPLASPICLSVSVCVCI